MKIKNIIESQRKLGGLISQIAYPILISLCVTIILQKWVGIPNLYQSRQGYWKENTLSLHLAILKNKTPEGKAWSDLGANGTNHRFFTVLVVDTLSKLSKKTIFSVYKWVDNFFIFVNLILLYLFLCQILGKPIALMGMLLFSVFQIPTFFYHYFHPWDRPSQFFWILSLWMLSKQRLGLLFIFFFLGFLIKYDVIMLSAVSFLFLFLSQERRKALLVSGGLFFLGLFIWLGMFYFLPNGYPEFSAGWERQYNLIQANLKQFFDEGVHLRTLRCFFNSGICFSFELEFSSSFRKSQWVDRNSGSSRILHVLAVY